MKLKWRLLLVGFALLIGHVAMASVDKAPTAFSKETKECIKCHKKHEPGIV
jgi:hypothetical protein